jgi:hypothetical protein
MKCGMHLCGVRSEVRVRRAVSGNDVETDSWAVQKTFIFVGLTSTLWQSSLGASLQVSLMKLLCLNELFAKMVRITVGHHWHSDAVLGVDWTGI